MFEELQRMYNRHLLEKKKEEDIKNKVYFTEGNLS